MLDRRRRLLPATAAATLGAAPALAKPAAKKAAAHAAARKVSDPAAEKQLNAVLEKIFQEQLKESPQGLTSLGLDKGENAWAKSRLDDGSAAAIQRNIGLQKGWLAEVKAGPPRPTTTPWAIRPRWALGARSGSSTARRATRPHMS